MLNSGSLGLLSSAAMLGGHYGTRGELTRTTPSEHSSGAAQSELLQALDRYVNRVAPNNPIETIHMMSTPQEVLDKGMGFLPTSTDEYASYGTYKGAPTVHINPNADRAFLAHELGHVAFGQTKAGELAQKLRRGSPKFAAVLRQAGNLAPAGLAALQPGDDDLTASIALSYGLFAPKLIDEVEGTRRGLKLLEEAKMPANRGQRARLAGSLMTYLAAPLAVGASGNVLGNMFDSDPAQTDSTLMP